MSPSQVSFLERDLRDFVTFMLGFRALGSTNGPLQVSSREVDDDWVLSPLVRV